MRKRYAKILEVELTEIDEKLKLSNILFNYQQLSEKNTDKEKAIITAKKRKSSLDEEELKKFKPKLYRNRIQKRSNKKYS